MRSDRTLALVAAFFKSIGWLTVMQTVLGAGGLVLGDAIFSLRALSAGRPYGALAIASAELIDLPIDLSTHAQPLQRRVGAPRPPRRGLPPPHRHRQPRRRHWPVLPVLLFLPQFGLARL